MTDIYNQNFYLKTKILLSLILLPAIALLFFLYASINLFVEDKINYIYDNQSNFAKSIALEITSRLNNLKKEADYLLIGLPANNQWNSLTKMQIENSQQIEGMLVFQRRRVKAFLEKHEGAAAKFLQRLPRFKSFLQEVELDDSALVYDRKSEILFYGFKKEKLVILLIADAREVFAPIRQPSNYSIALIDRAKKTLLSSQEFSPKQESRIPILYEKKTSTQRVRNSLSEEFFVSTSPLKDLPFAVNVALKTDDALSVLNEIYKKSTLIFLMLCSAATIVGVLLTERMTAALRQILAATQQITSGSFDLKIKIERRDEIGEIARSINLMAIEIKKLLAETITKTRMEYELKVAQLLQKTFFPAGSAEYSSCKIVGKYQPASECSGDWWFHIKINDKVYFFIGDATGHGVPAALMTASVSTAVKIIIESTLEPDQIVKKLSDTIYHVYQGNLLMTFLLGQFDPTRRTLTYVNASHDPAVVLRKSEHPLSRRDLVFLNEEVGMRIGESPQSSYQPVTLELNPGDRIFVFTDGFFEIKDINEEKLRERQFLKFLTEAHFESGSIEDFTNNFTTRVDNYTAIASGDDVTFFTFEAQ